MGLRITTRPRSGFVYYISPYLVSAGVKCLNSLGFNVTDSLFSAIHIVQALYYRHWFFIPTAALANIAEVLGWSARLWSSLNVNLETPFIMQ